MRTLLTCAAILACAACQKSTEPVDAANTTAEVQKIEAAETKQIASIGQKYLAGATDLYADDAVFISEDGTATQGKEAISAKFEEFLADPTLKLDYTPGTKVFSEGGDMAYSTAAYTETFTDPKTKRLVTMKGTNLSVWRKQADGSWKLVADSNPAGPAD
jgi:uncharacterized protein (TIGR02246 family)